MINFQRDFDRHQHTISSPFIQFHHFAELFAQNQRSQNYVYSAIRGHSMNHVDMTRVEIDPVDINEINESHTFPVVTITFTISYLAENVPPI